MKLLWIGGNHPRHLYFINQIQMAFDVCGALIEVREPMVPSPSADISEHDRRNFIRHFENRDQAERKYFGSQPLPQCPTLEASESVLNAPASVEFVKAVGPDVALIFGSGLIKEPLSSALPYPTLNLHLGLSPRYRGAATLFWPFYFLEPTYAGSTFHYIVAEPDAGEIVHQVVPDLEHGDTIHSVACKTVLASAEHCARLLRVFEQQGPWRSYKQRGSGKNFLNSDFRPEHLRVIYDLFEDNLATLYLEGKLRSKTPTLVRQF